MHFISWSKNAKKREHIKWKCATKMSVEQVE